MYHYCQYSFADLFLAAEGREISDKENRQFSKLTQTARNSAVAKLASKARWRTQLVDTDQGSFLAFWPGR